MPPKTVYIRPSLSGLIAQFAGDAGTAEDELRSEVRDLLDRGELALIPLWGVRDRGTGPCWC